MEDAYFARDRWRTENMERMKCDVDGHENGEDQVVCAACGTPAPVLALSGGGEATPVLVRSSLEVGRRMLSRLGEDAKYYSDPQCRVYSVNDGNAEEKGWFIEPIADAKYATLINGETLAAPARLAYNDVIAVGDASRKISMLPLKVSFRFSLE
jgi:hypothetical protein